VPGKNRLECNYDTKPIHKRNIKCASPKCDAISF
jgi:hypothetical protein